jgi:hypothetical protein
LAADEALLKRFVFLLGAERVVPAHRDCHLYELLRASETVGRALTNQFYALYADIRQRVLTRLCGENAAIAPPEILRCTQKLLDRVLFCAFCEDRPPHGDFGAVPGIGNDPGRATLPVVSAVLVRAPDIALFLAFLA